MNRSESVSSERLTLKSQVFFKMPIVKLGSHVSLFTGLKKKYSFCEQQDAAAAPPSSGGSQPPAVRAALTQCCVTAACRQVQDLVLALFPELPI